MFLSCFGPRSADGEIEPSLDLPVGVLGETDRARLADALQPRGDVDAIAHQIAVGLLDDVAQMDADPKLDALVGRDAQRCARSWPFWTSIAQFTASTTLRNSTSAPSPVRLTTRP